MANIQPLWARYDPRIPDIALEMIGPGRLRHTYAFREMHDQGAGPALSPDWQVSTLNPFENIKTALTSQARRNDDPGTPFLSGQALSIGDCIAGYTSGAPRACWHDSFSASLRPGFSADLVVTDQDIFRCAPDRVSAATGLLTLFKGREVWRDPVSPLARIA